MQKTNVYTIPKTYRPITKPILVAPRNDSSLWWPHTLSKTNEKLKLKQTVLLKPSDTIIYSGWIYIQFVIQFHFWMTYCYIYNEIIDSNTQSYSWFLEKYSLSLSLSACLKETQYTGWTDKVFPPLHQWTICEIFWFRFWTSLSKSTQNEGVNDKSPFLRHVLGVVKSFYPLARIRCLHTKTKVHLAYPSPC